MNDEIFEELQNTEKSLRDELSKVFGDDGEISSLKTSKLEHSEASTDQTTPETPAVDTPQSNNASTPEQEVPGGQEFERTEEANTSARYPQSEANNSKTSAEFRINRKSEDIRNLLETEKAIAASAYQKLVANISSALPPGQIRKEVAAKVDKQEPLKIYDIDELTGVESYDEATGEIKKVPGRINEETGAEFTEDEARMFNAQRRQYNEQLKEQEAEAIENLYNETVSNIDAELKSYAQKVQDNQIKLTTFLKDNPVFDIENNTMPGSIKTLTAGFWKDFYDKNVSEFIGQRAFDNSLDIYSEAEKFYHANKPAYYKALKEFYQKNKTEVSKSNKLKAIAPSSSKTASPSAPESQELAFARELEQSLLAGIKKRF